MARVPAAPDCTQPILHQRENPHENLFAVALIVTLLAGCTDQTNPLEATGQTPLTADQPLDAASKGGAEWQVIKLPAEDVFGSLPLATAACVGEDINLSGFFTFIIKEMSDGSGGIHFIYRLQDPSDLIATGVDTGTSYALSNPGYIQGLIRDGEFKVINHIELLQRRGPNGERATLKHDLHLIWDGNGEMRVSTDDTTVHCR